MSIMIKCGSAFYPSHDYEQKNEKLQLGETKIGHKVPTWKAALYFIFAINIFRCPKDTDRRFSSQRESHNSFYMSLYLLPHWSVRMLAPHFSALTSDLLSVKVLMWCPWGNMEYGSPQIYVLNKHCMNSMEDKCHHRTVNCVLMCDSIWSGFYVNYTTYMWYGGGGIQYIIYAIPHLHT